MLILSRRTGKNNSGALTEKNAGTHFPGGRGKKTKNTVAFSCRFVYNTNVENKAPGGSTDPNARYARLPSNVPTRTLAKIRKMWQAFLHHAFDSSEQFL